MNLLPDGYLADGIARPFIMRRIGMKAGRDCLFRRSIYCSEPRAVRLGNRVMINRDVYIDSYAPVTIGDDVSIGFRVLLITATHVLGPASKRAGETKGWPIVVQDGCWIAAGAIIGPGVTIGSGSVVSAGAVVMRSMPPNSLIAGNPARVIGRVEEHREDSVQGLAQRGH
jgi:maltose O-acetyltransferase